MKKNSDFWDALAPHHFALENNYFDLPSLARILPELHEPVLVVGAGQGLIVAELQKKGFVCDGVDFSAEMIRYAAMRRGVSLIQADARAIPLKDGSHQTIIYATGVVDFTSEDSDIKLILDEARRVVKPSGGIYVAFYRISPALENFLIRVGLLGGDMLSHRRSLELNRLNPFQMLNWVADKAGVGRLRAMFLMIRMFACSTLQEKRTALRMQKIFKGKSDADSLVESAAEKQPYRNESEIRNLFDRLGVPMKRLRTLKSCTIVEI